MPAELTALLPRFLLLVLLIFLSGFFSGSETALFSLQAIDRERLREEGSIVPQLLRDPRKTLASVLMGNELVNISLSAVCAGILLELAPGVGWLNLVVATPLLVLFGEVAPKTIALRNPRRIAKLVARPLVLWSTLIGPLRVGLTAIANLAIRASGASPESKPKFLQEEQVRMLIDEGLAAGSIKSMEHDLIHRVFSFSDAQVSTLMTPRSEILALAQGASYDEIVQTFRESGFSRLPVYRAGQDDIVGVLLSKDLLRFKPGPPPSPRQLRALRQRALFVPRSYMADELLQEFKSNHLHMAMVVDEHGGVVGLVTLDDLIRQLMGEQPQRPVSSSSTSEPT